MIETVTASALLVDADGVLLDSAPSIVAAFRAWGNEFGVDGEHVYEKMHGIRADEIAARVLDPPYWEAGGERLNWLELETAGSVRALAGAREFMERVHTMRWAVVTSAPRTLVLRRLWSAGLDQPPVLIAAEDVPHGKPHPACYLAALSALDIVDAYDALAFEDSPAGIESALAAGCRVVQTGSAHPEPYRNRAIASVDNLASVDISPVDGSQRIRVEIGLR